MYISKKTLLTVLSVILVLSLVVGGTLAYLQDTSVKVQNDFTKNEVRVDLYETADANSTEKLVSKSYSILPDTSAFKNPTVEVKNTVPAYVFVQATGNTKNMITWEIDNTAGWQPVPGVANVWYQEVDAQASGVSKTLNVIKDKTVSYSAAITNETIADDNLDFQAFAVQKDPINDVEKAWVLASTGVLASRVNQIPNTATPEEIAAAITTAANNNEPTAIVLPVSDDAIVLPGNITTGNLILIGQGIDSTTLDLVNYNKHAPMNATISDLTVVNSANVPSSGTWERVLESDLNSVTFKNCVIKSSDSGYDNAVYNSNATGNVLFENCTINGDVYGINFGHVNGTLTLRNCDITGWNSFGGATAGNTSKVIVENCRFHRSAAGYNVLRFYQDAEVTNCVFDKNFFDETADTYGKFAGGIEVNIGNVKIVLTGNTVVNGETQPLAASNFANNGFTGVTWILDKVDVSAQVS